jgi:hypothetical protein
MDSFALIFGWFLVFLLSGVLMVTLMGMAAILAMAGTLLFSPPSPE